jgi:hypothetical protein
LTVTEIISLLLTLGPQAVDLWFKIESLINLGPDEKANIASAIAASDQADSATIAAAATWLKANNYPIP